jgi:hypothetical protein
VLSPFDDYPIHQTSQPLLHTSGANVNAYDRYFFNGYTADASLFFGVALGLYPNRSVVDAGFSVIRDGVQRSVLASGRMDAQRATRVGPVRVEVVEPLRRHRVIVEEAHGLAADLTFTARTVAHEEPPFRAGGFDYTRLTQWGAWSGTVSVEGVSTTVEPAAVLGCRDRSWGVRPVGERVGRGAPPQQPPQFFWLWAPLNFPDGAAHFDVNEFGDGRRWHQGGSILPLLGPGDDPAADGAGPVVSSVDYELTWRPGTRHAAQATITLRPWGGEPARIELEPLLTFQMVGIGYGHPERGHGMWQGEQETHGMAWAVGAPDPTLPHHLHIQELVRARWLDRVGVGVLEQLAIGPHAPTGLVGVNDGWQPA